MIKKIMNFFNKILMFLANSLKKLWNKKDKINIGGLNKTKKVNTKNIEGGKFTKTKFNNCGDLTFSIDDHSSNSSYSNNYSGVVGNNSNYGSVINNIYTGSTYYNFNICNNEIGESLNRGNEKSFNKEDEEFLNEEIEKSLNEDESLKYILYELYEDDIIQIKKVVSPKTTPVILIIYRYKNL